jgi:cobalamin biosynthesis Mg chelatase CobN
VLDEERREAFLQALQSLQEEQMESERREKEERRYQEEQLKRDVEEARRRRIESEEREKREEEARNKRSEKGSEIDYGVEDSPPRPGSSKSRSSVKGGSAKGGRSLPSSSPTARSSVPAKNVKVPPSLLTRAGNVVMNVRKLVESMAGSFKTRPMLLMQILGFIVGILVLLSRRDVKERVKSILGKGWGKVRQTAGMGVKVSYI